ncbi:DUF2489 domain-containing protein [Thalassotalea fusca]
MTSPLGLTLIGIGALIIAGLAFYAGSLLRKLSQQNKAQAEAQIAHEKALNEHDKKVLDSVVIIVRAMKEEQCDISEGCWRLSVLLDSMKTVNGLSKEFPAVFELYEAIKHMPILEARKQLAKKERMKLDLERTKVEARLFTDVHQNIELIHQYAIEKLSTINSQLVG